jgi:hypothetical protein
VLVTRGTAAWIAAITHAAAVPSVPPARGAVPEGVPVASAPSLPAAGEIVAVLAQMAFAIAA